MGERPGLHSGFSQMTGKPEVIPSQKSRWGRFADGRFLSHPVTVSSPYINSLACGRILWIVLPSNSFHDALSISSSESTIVLNKSARIKGELYLW